MPELVTLTDYFATWLPRIEREMRAVVNAGPQPTWFNTMLRYHLGFANPDGSPARVAGGKRIRPILLLLACEACGGSAESALPAAAAVELLHNFSLIHDDIEDGDALRRGRPTVWKRWGVAQAINAGDAMFAQAHLALQRLEDAGVPASSVLRSARAFDRMCVQLTIGQHLDMSFEARADVSAADYLQMVEGKTAALVRAACEIGAIAAGAPDAAVDALAAFGKGVGLAFQLQDDVLGIWGETDRTGKAQGDLARRKKTLPVLYAADRDADLRRQYFSEQPFDEGALRGRVEALGGREHTQRSASDMYSSALAALTQADLRPGPARMLAELATSLIERTS